METIYLSIPLPNEIKAKLQRVCYGLPNVRWQELDQFHIPMVCLEIKEGSFLLDIEEKLRQTQKKSFLLALDGINGSHTKGSRGTIWAEVESSESLHQLKKEIVQSLADLPLKCHLIESRITLLHYDRLAPNKIADYLAANHDFMTLPFRVDSFVLLLEKQTYYLEKARFSLNP